MRFKRGIVVYYYNTDRIGENVLLYRTENKVL